MSQITFLTVTEFKAKVNATKMDVLENPKTGKLFLAADNGQNYKVQAAIDGSKEYKMLIPEDGDLSQACLTNVKPGAAVIFSM